MIGRLHVQSEKLSYSIRSYNYSQYECNDLKIMMKLNPCSWVFGQTKWLVLFKSLPRAK